MSTNYSSQYTNLGQANLDGDLDALFKEKFIPELLTAFDERRVMQKLVRHKVIDDAKGAYFYVYGKSGAKYFARGEEAVGNQKIAKNRISINIDPLLVWDLAIYEVDEFMSETEDRAIFVQEGARALANTEDKQLLQVAVLAARSEANVTGGNAGSVISASGMKTDASVLAASIYAAGTAFDEKDIDENNRYCVVKPLQYNLLCQYENIADKNIGGGSYEQGTSGMLDNIKIIKSNHLPDTVIDYSADETQPNNVYYGDFTNTAGVVFTPQAIGTISLKGLRSEISWQPKSFHNLFTARILQGHGILRPDCAVELAEA
ncbi:MAG: hypothetical protein LUH05_03255 [Candidatus Gastranaerophilales bacterium]|nr:hypothetical protein [Candidatus Gastranaerophilales bacterium]